MSAMSETTQAQTWTNPLARSWLFQLAIDLAVHGKAICGVFFGWFSPSFGLKSSLHCSATFRKMFPEYVEKHNRQVAEQAQSEVSSLPSQEEESRRPNSERVVNNNNVHENVGRAEGRGQVGINNRRQSMPTWMVLFVFSIFGLVMALPLLQPWRQVCLRLRDWEIFSVRSFIHI